MHGAYTLEHRRHEPPAALAGLLGKLAGVSRNAGSGTAGLRPIASLASAIACPPARGTPSLSAITWRLTASLAKTRYTAINPRLFAVGISGS